ncbi:acetyltransferase [Ligilactobacillus salitolerans]|uniref:Acetyltransferase n=1 Tax=Ligilactobacillus salitolerans TaxID=1808352 RepID=A0A401IPV2_9LACO|nr:GNAT family N-acetyltransferase [Ligilactobacillus salitolerans]GBG93556.1 acetyltransferase [Ligilactobacillus salitolerans]
MYLEEQVTLTAKQQSEVIRLLTAIHQADQSFRDPYLSNQFNYFPDMPTFILAYEKSMLIGFTMLYADGEVNEPIDLYLNVLPKFRNQGIATLMLEHAQQILSSFGYHKIEYVSEKSFLQRNPNFLAKTALTIGESEYQMRCLAMPRDTQKLKTDVDLNVRKMQASDADRLIALQSEAFAIPEDESKTYIDESFNDVSTLTFVLEYKSEVIGYCAIDNGQDYYFFGLVVDAKFRNHGYGTFFIKTIMQILELQQHKAFVLGVEKDNLAALHAYKNAGFYVETEIVYLVSKG